MLTVITITSNSYKKDVSNLSIITSVHHRKFFLQKDGSVCILCKNIQELGIEMADFKHDLAP